MSSPSSRSDTAAPLQALDLREQSSPVDFAPTRRGHILPLEATGLTLSRNGRSLIDNIDLRLEGTGITMLMGPNGAGKSLLLRLLAGLVEPDDGSVTWCGRRPMRESAANLGFVFQKPVLLRRSVLANLTHALAAAGHPRAGREAHAMAALDLGGLAPLAKSPARVLSGGEQQRLALVRALALRPELLLLDEPTASLDPSSTHAIEALVRNAADAGTRILFVTHDLGQARRLADNVMFVHAGRIIETTEAGRFFDRPGTPQAKAFLGGGLLL